MQRCNPPLNLSAEQKGKDIFYSWDVSQSHTSYTIDVEDITTGYQRRDIVYDNRYKLQGIKYDHEYRLKVQAVCNNNDMYPSEFTEWKKFKPVAPPTPEELCPDCVCEDLDKNPAPITNTELRRDLKTGDIITRTSTKTRFEILSAKETSAGVYEGQFYFIWDIYGGGKSLANYRDLRVNTDNECLSGVKWKTVKIAGYVANVDAIKDAFGGGGGGGDGQGGSDNGGTIDTVKADFEIPDDPQIAYNDSTGELTVTDKDGDNPHTITLPRDSSGNTDFPVTIVDGGGGTYTVTKDGNGNVHIEKQENKPNEENSVSAENDNTQDLSIHFIIKKLVNNQITNDSLAEAIAKNTGSDNYYSSGDNISLEDGRYIIVPVRKNIKYSYKTDENSDQEVIVIKEFQKFRPYVIKNGEFKRTGSWADNPYNIYKVTNSENTANNKRYYEITINSLDKFTLKFETENINSSYGDLESGADVETVAYYNEDNKIKFNKNISLYSKECDITISGIKREAGLVYFVYANENTYDGTFGFDIYDETKLSAFKNNYTDKLSIKKSDGSNVEYIVPSVSNWAGESTKIMARISENKDGSKLYYKFQPSNGLTVKEVSCAGREYTYENNVFEAENGKYDLLITLEGNKYNKAQLLTLLVTDRNNDIVGKLNFYSRTKSDNIDITYKIVNVTFGNAQSDIIEKSKYIENGDLINFLNNRSFNQAFMQFEYGKIYRDLLIEQSAIPREIKFSSNNKLDSASDNRKNIRNFLQSRYNSNISGNERVIFLINNQEMEGNVVGFANAKDNIVVVLKPAVTDWETFVHEIGHTLGLKHPFEISTNFRKGNSTNFMDYSVKQNMFWQWQWKAINKNDFEQ
jgi:hypothetical protein